MRRKNRLAPIDKATRLRICHRGLGGYHIECLIASSMLSERVSGLKKAFELDHPLRIEAVTDKVMRRGFTTVSLSIFTCRVVLQRASVTITRALSTTILIEIQL